MNKTKYFGSILAIIGSLGASISIHPLALPLAFVGILLYIQGTENKILELTQKATESSEKLILRASETLSNQLSESKE